MPCDYRRYPPDWKQRRARILKRAGNKCEDCGVKNHSYRGSTRIVLTTAHLDHDEGNWEVADDRLRALCQKCHLALDHHRHVNHAALTRDSNRGQLRLDVEPGGPR